MSSSDIGLQDTEPLTPDAARIVELERRNAALLAAIEHLARQSRRWAPVLQAAVTVGYWWIEQDGIGKAELDALAEAVQGLRSHHAVDELTAEAEKLGLYDAPPLQPKG